MTSRGCAARLASDRGHPPPPGRCQAVARSRRRRAWPRPRITSPMPPRANVEGSGTGKSEASATGVRSALNDSAPSRNALLNETNPRVKRPISAIVGSAADERAVPVGSENTSSIIAGRAADLQPEAVGHSVRDLGGGAISGDAAGFATPVITALRGQPERCGDHHIEPPGRTRVGGPFGRDDTEREREKDPFPRGEGVDSNSRRVDPANGRCDSTLSKTRNHHSVGLARSQK